jgi:hypothetical protein
MCDTFLMKMLRCGSDAEEDGLALGDGEDGFWEERIAGACFESWRESEVGVEGGNEFEDETFLLWVVVDGADGVNEIGMLACCDTGVHFVQG